MGEKQFLPSEFEYFTKKRTESDDQKLKDGAKLVVDAGSDKSRLEFTKKQMEEAEEENKLSEDDWDEKLETEHKKIEKLATPLDDLIAGINDKGLAYQKSEYTDTHSYYFNPESGRPRDMIGKGMGASTEYADEILDSLRGSERKDGLRNFLKELGGSIVLDLGSRDGIGYFVSMECNARAYVGVEKFGTPNIDTNFDVHNVDIHNYPDVIPFSLVQEDMLDFLKRLPDNSVSILAAGVIEDIGYEYAQSVNKEIVRVLDPQGAYINYFSSFEPEGLIKDKSKDFMDVHGGLLKFTKPKQ